MVFIDVFIVYDFLYNQHHILIAVVVLMFPTGLYAYNLFFLSKQ